VDDPALFPDRLRLPFDFDAALLARDLDVAVAEGWTKHFIRQNYDGEWDIVALRAPAGARHKVQQIYANPFAEDYADTEVLARCPYFRDTLRRFPCPLRSVRLMRLGPGSVIKEHVDELVGVEDGVVRLHIPIVTNDGVDFRLNGRRLTMKPGETWYVAVAGPHSVANRGATARVHLVIDAVLDAWLAEVMAGAEKAKVRSAGHEPHPSTSSG
jgi:aspartyl/asparaginyl beta-hydroxylase